MGSGCEDSEDGTGYIELIFLRVLVLALPGCPSCCVVVVELPLICTELMSAM